MEISLALHSFIQGRDYRFIFPHSLMIPSDNNDCQDSQNHWELIKISSTLLSTLCAFFHVILTTTLRGHYRLWNEAFQSLWSLSEIIQLVSWCLNTVLNNKQRNLAGATPHPDRWPYTLLEQVFIPYCTPCPKILFCCEIGRANSVPFTESILCNRITCLQDEKQLSWSSR